MVKYFFFENHDTGTVDYVLCFPNGEYRGDIQSAINKIYIEYSEKVSNREIHTAECELSNYILNKLATKFWFSLCDFKLGLPYEVLHY